MLTTRQLLNYANSFLGENYGMTLSVPLKINGRLKRTVGYFKYTVERPTEYKEAKSVELSKIFVENNKKEIVLDVLKHELVHYALFMQGKPNSDGHPVFENELRRLGIVSQDTINKYNIKSEVHVYECSNCGLKFHKTRRLKHNGRYHCCGKCGGSLIDKGKEVM